MYRVAWFRYLLKPLYGLAPPCVCQQSYRTGVSLQVSTAASAGRKQSCRLKRCHMHACSAPTENTHIALTNERTNHICIIVVYYLMYIVTTCNCYLVRLNMVYLRKCGISLCNLVCARLKFDCRASSLTESQLPSSGRHWNNKQEWFIVTILGSYTVWRWVLSGLHINKSTCLNRGRWEHNSRQTPALSFQFYLRFIFPDLQRTVHFLLAPHFCFF